MKSLRLYRVEDSYIRYLSKADKNVQHNKNARRPYVGVVLTISSFRYFVPMESPKKSHETLKPSTHIMPIDGGKYGLLGFNNMIPVPDCALIEFDIRKEPDAVYAELLKRQVSYINHKKADVYDRASRTYRLAVNANPGSFYKRVCCNFQKLERMCSRYAPDYSPIK